jgi:uncharacterized RDD family membrane protein YckC
MIDYSITGFLFLGALIALSILSVSGQWIYSLVFFLIQWFFMAACEAFSGGLTFGKRIVGLRVLMRDGTRITPGAAVMRNLLRVADQYAAIGLVAMLVVPGFRRIGDLVSGTVVIHSSQRLARPIPTGAFSGVEPIAPRRPVDEEASDAAVEYARRRAQLGAARAEELAGIGLPLYLDENASGDRFASGGQSDSEALAGVGAWCAGIRAAPGAEETAER